MDEYRFISTTGSDGVAASADGAARSHAIRAGIRHGWATAGTANKQSRATTKRKNELKGRFRLITQTPSTALDGVLHTVDEPEAAFRCAQLFDSAIPRLRTTLLNNGFEPFDCLPIPQNQQVKELTQYFLTKFRLNGSEVGTKKVWFSYAMRSAVVMHSTIALSAACLTAEKRSDHRLWQEGLCQKGKAMRLVGEWLLQTKMPREDTRCASILTAICTLSSSETMYGNFEAANTHLLGVRNLFYSLDGTERFRNEYALYKSINTADMFLATAIRRLPFFPMLHPDLGASLPEFIHEQALEQPLHKFVTDSCGDDMFHIFSTLRLAVCAKRSGLVSPDSIRTVLNLAEYRLLEKCYGDFFEGVSDSDGSVVSAVALAAHLFLYVILREVPTNLLLMRIMSSRMHESIRKMTDAQRRSPKNAAVLEWVACVGVLGTWTGASEISVESRYFVTLLQKSQRGSNATVYDVAELGQRLSLFLWDAERCNQTMREALGWG